LIILWIKALHVIAVISWMAGLLYLPRLYVYHSQVEIGSAPSEIFKTMEHRLLRFIMNPAMILTWLLGLSLLIQETELMRQGWIHAKLLLVILLSGCHGFLAVHRKAFFLDQRLKSENFWRFFNEAPTILMIGIVILVIVKPF
jgi:putative membrane protein